MAQLPVFLMVTVKKSVGQSMFRYISRVIPVFLALNLLPANVSASPASIAFTVVQPAASSKPGEAMSAQLSLSYIATDLSDIADLQLVLKSLPSGAPTPYLVNGSATAVPSAINSKVSITLNPTIYTKIPGTYVYVAVASFKSDSSKTSTLEINYVLSATTPTPEPTPTTVPCNAECEAERKAIAEAEKQASDPKTYFPIWVKDAQVYFTNVVLNTVKDKYGNVAFKFLNQIPAVPAEIQANPSAAGFGVYKMMLKQWVDSEVLNLPKNPSVSSQSNTGQTQTPEASTFCRDMLAGVQSQIDVGIVNFKNWQTLWSDRNSLLATSKAKGWRVLDLSNNYLSYVNSEIQTLYLTVSKYDIDGKLKMECGNSQQYSQWGSVRQNIFNLINNFIDILMPFIESKNLEFFGEIINENQQQKESWDNQEIFEEQVDHYYLKYVTSIQEEIKKRAIQFKFSTSPPIKPSWTSIKDGSNAKKMDLYVSQMNSWWSIEGKRFTEAIEQHDLKNIAVWIKEIQNSWSDYITRLASEKFGAGGVYNFLKAIPRPSTNLLENPNSEEKLKYEDLVSEWANFEITNLRAENYSKQTSKNTFGVKNLALSSAIVNAGGIISITFDAFTNNENGEIPRFRLQGDYTGYAFQEATLISGTKKEGKWKGSLELPQSLFSGAYLIEVFFGEYGPQGFSNVNGNTVNSGLKFQLNNPVKNWTQTKIVLNYPESVNIGNDGFARFEVIAYAIPIDSRELPSGLSSLTEFIAYKGGCGFNSGDEVREEVVTSKPGFKHLLLKFTLKTPGICSGQIRYYGDETKFARTDGFFNIKVNATSNLNAITIKDVYLYSQKVNPGGVATIYYWVTKPAGLPTGGLGAGLGEFGSDEGIFGQDYSSIGWTLGFVKGESPDNGLYKSNINIPSNAKPGTYQTWVFWKGRSGPVYGPSITISNADNENPNSLICVPVLQKAESFVGNFASQISYLTKVWSSFSNILGVIKSKNISLTSYWIMVNSEIQNSFLSNLYLQQKSLIEVKAACTNFNATSIRWYEAYSNIDGEISRLNLVNRYVNEAYQKYNSEQPRLVPKIGKITQIVGGCQVEILNYDPTFRWFAKGDLVIDINGIATITNGSTSQYLSTDKPGYQVFNHIEGIFDCKGLTKIADNVVDVSPPKLSLIGLSRTELYKGQSVVATVLITDNKEVNSFRVALVDQIGQTYPCYEGVAWKSRIKGDNLVGTYQVECWIRSVSYDGIWALTGYATDLNSNSSVDRELAKVRILYGEAPTAIESLAVNTSMTNSLVSNRVMGSAASIISEIKNNVDNETEANSLLAAVERVESLPKVTKLSRINNLTSIKGQINVVIETPKICTYSSGSIVRKLKGNCVKTIEIQDSSGTSYMLTQKLQFK
jgi:hypothetical protein